MLETDMPYWERTTPSPLLHVDVVSWSRSTPRTSYVVERPTWMVRVDHEPTLLKTLPVEKKTSNIPISAGIISYYIIYSARLPVPTGPRRKGGGG